MTKTVFINCTLDELQELIRDAVKEVSQNTTEQKNEIFTIEEAADYLQIPKNTLYQFTHRRKIPFHKIGRSLRFKKSDLNDWIDDNRRKTHGEIIGL